MRLTRLQILIIKESFKKHFVNGDVLWLFGSRADDSQRGGDIDLFIETQENEYSVVSKRKSAFWIDLQNKLGEQKIDIVLNRPCDDQSKLIFSEARKGIILMRKEHLFERQVKIAAIHVKKLQEALVYSKPILPITQERVTTLSFAEWTALEAICSRFAKLQDILGRKILPTVLNLMTDIPPLSTLIDRLHMLEKIEFLKDTNWWNDLKDLRDAITHDYEEDPDLMVDHINKITVGAQELLDYWDELKPKLDVLISKLPQQ